MPNCVSLPAHRGRLCCQRVPADLPLGARLAQPGRAHPTSWASDCVSSGSSSSSKCPRISSKALASSFLDSGQALLKKNEELLSENSRLRTKLRQALQVQQGEVVPKTKSSFGGRGMDSSIEESLQDALELSSDAQALSSVNETDLRDVIQKSNEAAADALSAAQVAVWTEAIALIGCVAGICSSWISWKMDDDELPPELQIHGKGGVPGDLLMPPPSSRIATIPRQRGSGDARAQNDATSSAVPPMPKQTFASSGSSRAAASSKAAPSTPAGFSTGGPVAVSSPASAAAGAKASAPVPATTRQGASSAQDKRASRQVPASTALGAETATSAPAAAAPGAKATASVPTSSASEAQAATSAPVTAAAKSPTSSPTSAAEAAAPTPGAKAASSVPASVVDETPKKQKPAASSDVEAATTASASGTTGAQSATPTPISEVVGAIPSNTAAEPAAAASGSSSASTGQAASGPTVPFPKSPPQSPSTSPQIPAEQTLTKEQKQQAAKDSQETF